MVCTGIVGNEVFDEFGFSRDAVRGSIENVRMISPFGTSLVYRHPEAFAYVLDRGGFDRSIAEDVWAYGGRIEPAMNVLDVRIAEECAEVLVEFPCGEAGRFCADLVIVATGVNHTLTKKLGLGYAREFLNGVQTEVKTDELDLTTIAFGNTIAPGAFGWAVPLENGEARIGLLTDRNPGFYFHSLLKSLLPESSDGIDEDALRFKSIAQGVLSRTYGDRLLAVGEAAGQVKTTTGGGIYYGLLCAELASKIILKNWPKKNFRSKQLAEYERIWKQKILKELMVGYYARKLGAKLTDNQIEKLFFLAKTNGIFPFIQQNGKFDWHSDLILGLIKKVPFFKNLL